MSLRIHKVEQRSEKWHELRRGIVTASTVSNLLTPTGRVADNDTSRGVVAALVAERMGFVDGPGYMNDDMMRGVLHEPIARARYAEVNKVEVSEIGFAVRTFDGGIKLGASPDGLVGDDGGIEIKCPRPKTHVRTIVSGEVPSGYLPQIQASLLVLDRKWWDYVSFAAGMPMFVKRVYPDAAFHESIVVALKQTEEQVKAMTTAFHEAAIGLPATERVPDYFEEMSL